MNDLYGNHTSCQQVRLRPEEHPVEAGSNVADVLSQFEMNGLTPLETVKSLSDKLRLRRKFHENRKGI